MTVVCWNFARRSGVDLPRETVQSFPYLCTTVTHTRVIRWALPHRDFDRSFGGRVRRFNDRCHFAVDLSIPVSTTCRTYIGARIHYWITKNATIYYRIRGEYLPVSKLQLYSRNVAHWWLHLYGLKCPQDPWSIRDWSRELTRNGSRNRIWRSSIIACITVASSSEDGPGTIRNFETIPLFGKRQENTGLLLGWRLRCRLSRTYERSKVKKWGDACGVF